MASHMSDEMGKFESEDTALKRQNIAASRESDKHSDKKRLLGNSNDDRMEDEMGWNKSYETDHMTPNEIKQDLRTAVNKNNHSCAEVTHADERVNSKEEFQLVAFSGIKNDSSASNKLSYLNKENGQRMVAGENKTERNRHSRHRHDMQNHERVKEKVREKRKHRRNGNDRKHDKNHDTKNHERSENLLGDKKRHPGVAKAVNGLSKNNQSGPSRESKEKQRDNKRDKEGQKDKLSEKLKHEGEDVRIKVEGFKSVDHAQRETSREAPTDTTLVLIQIKTDLPVAKETETSRDSGAESNKYVNRITISDNQPVDKTAVEKNIRYLGNHPADGSRNGYAESDTEAGRADDDNITARETSQSSVTPRKPCTHETKRPRLTRQTALDQAELLDITAPGSGSDVVRSTAQPVVKTKPLDMASVGEPQAVICPQEIELTVNPGDKCLKLDMADRSPSDDPSLHTIVEVPEADGAAITPESEDAKQQCIKLQNKGRRQRLKANRSVSFSGDQVKTNGATSPVSPTDDECDIGVKGQADLDVKSPKPRNLSRKVRNFARQLSEQSTVTRSIRRKSHRQRPNTFFDVALFACCCCCSPLGGVGMVLSVLSDNAFKVREYDKAQKYRRAALGVAIGGICLTIVLVIILLVTRAFPRIYMSDSDT